MRGFNRDNVFIAEAPVIDIIREYEEIFRNIFEKKCSAGVVIFCEEFDIPASSDEDNRDISFRLRAPK